MVENATRPAHSNIRLPAPVDIGPYTKIPNKSFGSGTGAKLGRSSALLFLALCEHANRNGSMSFKASDAALASDTGLAPRTICDARKRLLEYGLISCRRQDGHSYTYTLKKYNFDWQPVRERRRPKCNPRALHAARIKTVALPPTSRLPISASSIIA